MLSAHKYEKTRQAFSDSINQFIQGYREFLSGLLASERTRQVAALAAAFLIFAISLAVWIVLVRRLDRRQRAYRQEILERRKAEEELSRLAGHLQSVREQERTAIAREVHDEMGQALAALKIDLVRLRNHIPSPPDDVRDLLQTMLGAITDTIDSVQRILSELRPSVLDYLGLVAAIEWQANEFQSHTGIECVLSVVTEDPDLERDEKTALFRILQESLTNVARHADATRVEIRFAVEHPWLVLSINDNGAGISEWDAHSGKSYGLMGMRERAHVFGGRLEIAGTSGQGTTVRVRIPIRSQAPDPEGLPA
jgi:signal transduction histidine kinase